MAGALLTQWAGGDAWMVPGSPPVDIAVQPNFERFDGLEPLDGHAPGQIGKPTRSDGTTPQADQTFTASPVGRLTNTVGGQPLPVADAIHRQPGATTLVNTPSMQQRLGVGQNATGVAQTVALAGLTTHPPQPGDISAIIAGQA